MKTIANPKRRTSSFSKLEIKNYHKHNRLNQTLINRISALTKLFLQNTAENNF